MPRHALAGRHLPRPSLHLTRWSQGSLRSHGRVWAVVVAGAFVTLATDVVRAQTSTVAPPPASSGELSPAERARRDADKVFHWIMIHSDKPRKAKAEMKPEAKSESRREEKQAVAPALTATAAQKPVRPEPAPPVASKDGGERSKKDLPAGSSSPSPQQAAPVPAAELAKAAAPETAAAAKQVAAIAPNQAASPAAEEDDEDVALVPVMQTEPEFPATVMRQLRKGLVQVRFDVQADGTVAKAEVVKTTHRRLNDGAIAAVSQWRFQPLRKTQTAMVELGFNLD